MLLQQMIWCLRGPWPTFVLVGFQCCFDRCWQCRKAIAFLSTFRSQTLSTYRLESRHCVLFSHLGLPWIELGNSKFNRAIVCYLGISPSMRSILDNQFTRLRALLNISMSLLRTFD